MPARIVINYTRAAPDGQLGIVRILRDPLPDPCLGSAIIGDYSPEGLRNNGFGLWGYLVLTKRGQVIREVPQCP
jgi:hypothetical protein